MGPHGQPYRQNAQADRHPQEKRIDVYKRQLLAYYQGPWQGLPAKYEAILAYARDHELTLTGFAYEKGVNELVIQQDEDYITQIEIPVQDPCSDGSSPRSHRTT